MGTLERATDKVNGEQADVVITVSRSRIKISVKSQTSMSGRNGRTVSDRFRSRRTRIGHGRVIRVGRTSPNSFQKKAPALRDRLPLAESSCRQK